MTPRSIAHLPSHRTLRPLLAALLAASCPLAYAQLELGEQPPMLIQDKAPAFRQFNKVEITGSSIIRKEQTQSLPVQVISHREIVNSGATDLAEVVQKHSSMLDNINPAQLGNVIGGYESVGLHGFQKQTLVLLNGARLAPYGRSTITGSERSGVDLRMIPLTTVDRIEILSDGASSIYGTDAIAGVINIITNKEKSGVEINANTRIPNGQKGESQLISLTWGKGSLNRDGYSFYVSADHEHQKQLYGRDRPYASAGRYELERNGQNYWAYGSSNTATPYKSSPVTAYQSATTTLFSGTKYWSANYVNGTCPAGNIPVYGQNACYYNYYADTGLYPKNSTTRIHTQGEKWIDAQTTLYVEAGYRSIKEIRDTYLWPQAALRIGSNTDSVGYNLASQNGFTPGNTYLLWRPTDMGLLNQVYEQQESRLKLGAKGVWHDWDYNAHFNYSENIAHYGRERVLAYPATLLLNSSSRLNNVATLTPLSSSSAESQALREQLLSLRTFDNIERGKNSLQSLNMSASRSIAEIDEGDVLLAVGSSWRKETTTFEGLHTEQVRSAPDYSAQRSVVAAFAELQTPVTSNLELLASLRHDRYSDVGTTTNGKVSALWTITPQLSARASTGAGFRAPSVAQAQNVSTPYIDSGFSYPCNSALQQVITILQQQGYAAKCDPGGMMYLASVGNPDLKPETSRQDNLGIRYKWSANHTLAVDWWRVRINNAFMPYPASTVLADPLKHLEYFYYDPTQGVSIYNRLVNFGYQFKSGLDLHWQYRQPTSWGLFNLNLMGTRLLQSKEQVIPDTPAESILKNTPRYRLQIDAGLAQESWHWLLSWRQTGGYQDSSVSAINIATGKTETLDPGKVRPFTTVDLTSRYQATKNLTYYFRAENIFNQQAPMTFRAENSSSTVFGTSGTYANWWGRTVTLGLSARF